MKFNASMLKTWMTCPLQARFKEIEKRPWKQNAKASFGTCMHEALDQYNHSGDVAAATARFLETWDNPDILGVAPDYWPKFTTFGGLRKRGIEIFQMYDEKNRWVDRNVVATEHKFMVPFGDHYLSGIVDLIEFKKAGRGRPTLVITDYKTNSRKPNKLDLMMDVQFTTYIYASLQPEFWLGYEPEIEKYSPMQDGETLMNTFEGMDRRAVWYHLMDNKEIDAGPRDDNDFMRLYRVCEEIANAVEKQVFVPAISGDSCTWCDYKDTCQVVIPIYDKLDLEIDEL